MKEFTADLIKRGYKLVKDCPRDHAQIWTDGKMDFVLFYDDGGNVIDFSAHGVHLE